MKRNGANNNWIHSLVRRSGYIAIALAVAMAIACSYFRIHSTRDLTAYVGMSFECHPVWKELALHRIQLGQPINVVIAQTKPISIERHGRFVELGYQERLSFTGVQIIAMDGKLVRASAGSCTWDHTFFDAMNEMDCETYSTSREHNPRTVEFKGKIVELPEAADNVKDAALE